MRRVECFFNLFFFVYILIVKCLLTVLSSGSGRASERRRRSRPRVRMRVVKIKEMYKGSSTTRVLIQ